MLLVPYCKLSLGELRIAPLHVRLLLVQIAGGLGLYLALAPIDPLLAQGTFICVLAPTATSAAVVTGMLGGSVASLATYCLLSNMVVALISRSSSRSSAHRSRCLSSTRCCASDGR